MLWVMLVMTLCDKVCQWLSCKLKVTMLLTSPKIKIGWRKQCCIRLKNIWKSILIRLIDILEINANCSTLYFRYIMASILIWNSSVYYDVVDNDDFLGLGGVWRTFVAVIVWWLDLQLYMQSVPITTDVVSSNLDQGEVYNIM